MTQHGQDLAVHEDGLLGDAVKSIAEYETGSRPGSRGQDAHAPRKACFLARATDRAKDQSYFLYGVPRELLPYLHLPLGELTKDQARETARACGIHVADRPESMELCFAGEDDYRRALGGAGCQPGEIVLAADGRVLGEHPGIAYFTPGQRQGLKVAWTEALYVLGVEPDTRRVVVGTREEAFADRVAVRELNVLQPAALTAGAGLGGKTRSGGDPAPCRLEAVAGDRLTVAFDEPVFAPAPGQHLVLYDREERVVAGGVMEREATAVRPAR